MYQFQIISSSPLNTHVHTLFEGLLSIGQKAFSKCKSLITINIPSTVTAIEKDAFDECPLLRNISISPSPSLGKVVEFESTFSNIAKVGCTFEMLRDRFDNLPVHRLCFYHLHQSDEHNKTFELLKEMVLYPTTNGDKVYCLGMTPLHVLACSGTNDLRLYRCLVDHYPDTMLTEDKWGETPLFYMLLFEPTMDIIHYFFEMHRRKWGTIPIDFGAIIKMLAKYKSIDYVRYIIKAQRTYFPGLKIDWKSIIDESFACDCICEGRLLIKASSFAGSSEMSSEREAEVKRRYDDFIASDHSDNEAHDKIDRLIIDSIWAHNDFLMNASTLLEMVLWKIMLNESSHQRKRKKIDDRQARMDIRWNSGEIFQAVIPNVLSFL
jgi:hypothetical protein